MRPRAFRQIDVFTAEAGLGNPVAVVLDAQGLDEAAMQRFARWTNLSETTFVLPPTDAAADYRLRIFTPGGELPFAGHPTLGSARAWLDAGGQARGGGAPVQQCAIGLVSLRRDGERLAFAAPPRLRQGPVEPALQARIARALRLDVTALKGHQWVDNGPGWVAVMLDSADTVLALQPDFAAMQGLKLGVLGPHAPGHDCRYEVRAFVPDLGVPEDPVTGSLNAGLAQWLIGEGLAPSAYIASQGTALGRAGRVHVEQRGDTIWIGGDTVVCIEGSVRL
jgi:PhzF family phenazine biosynthesis protein